MNKPSQRARGQLLPYNTIPGLRDMSMPSRKKLKANDGGLTTTFQEEAAAPRVSVFSPFQPAHKGEWLILEEAESSDCLANACQIWFLSAESEAGKNLPELYFNIVYFHPRLTNVNYTKSNLLCQSLSLVLKYQKLCGQQDQGSDSPPLLGTIEATPRILCPVLGLSQQEGCFRDSSYPEKGNGGGEGSGPQI
ncbi:hypothetical protein DUI87_05744 [Hirundo rustica rustica]|uniref:Uncharacterized protein n=1 Tax=Hirundo rustica rustica TaxID=333673 RepID=A0A3M0LDG1_HIRRU|nr:hypothetical protein DUI87_05744 [Hirundo rustica rustica]